MEPAASPGLLEREADLRASLGYNVADVQRVLDLMVDDRLRVSPVYNAEPVSLAELPALLGELAEAPAGRLKQMVAPSI